MRLALLSAALLLSACGTTSSREGASADPSDSSAEPIEAELRRFAGVDVRESAGGIQVRVRGETSFMAGQEPLYVIDGSPVAPGPGGTLAGLSRADITDIRVLKNASETSVYGPRGANGVVVITTRRGAN
ncbi:TonB-dependent receptor plug domain-containing protein [Rubrivirga sp. IMCC43871]|uniref:TonB-dependent receptor plug domain-containing protein n=1 Tax=Rubrivirga sp. IMCC43871 TaxID=3391575 RepID=UPI00398FAB45